ncbi:unnamed protein product [Prunus brigantina]
METEPFVIGYNFGSLNWVLVCKFSFLPGKRLWSTSIGCWVPPTCNQATLLQIDEVEDVD